MYVLLCSQDPYDNEDQTKAIYWAVGQRMPDQRFKKVSVFMMDDWTEAQRLYDLPGVMVKSHNVLV